jgi:hypothetical protein
MVDLLSCSVNVKLKSLEFMFNENMVLNFPILSYSKGYFYFFEDECVFDNFCSNFMNKPFYDKSNRNRARELVGAYPCDLNLVGENLYSLSKPSIVDGSYKNLREIILNYMSQDNTKLYFKGLNGVYVSSTHLK